MNKKQKLIQLLRILSDLAEDLSDEDIAELPNVLRSEVQKASKRRSSSSKGRVAASDHIKADIQNALESLDFIKTREEGFQYLERFEFSKQSLETIARRLDIPVTREDNLRGLITKIVERSVGSRLNSQAIRGDVSQKI